MVENFTLTLADYQKDICSSSSEFAENLQTVLNISTEEAEDIVSKLPYEIDDKMCKQDAQKLAELLEAFGAIVLIQDELTKNLIVENLIAENQEVIPDPPLVQDNNDLECDDANSEEVLLEDIAVELVEELAEEMTSDALFGTEGVAPISFDLELDEPEDILFASPNMSNIEEEMELPLATKNIVSDLNLDEDLVVTPQVAELSHISLSSDDEEDLTSSCEIQPMISLSTEEDSAEPEIISSKEKVLVNAKKQDIPIEVEKSTAFEEPEIPTFASPFVEKKRSLTSVNNKLIAPGIVVLLALLGGVFYFSSGETPATPLQIDVNSELVQNLLVQGQSSKQKEIVATNYSNFEGKLDSEVVKIEARVNKANDKIENLKISLQALTDKLTTADEFIAGKFYPHLNSLEVEIKDTQGSKIEDWYSFKGSARAFYMHKNISSKGIVDVYINIKEDNSELIISNAPTTTTNTAEIIKPELLDANGKTEFQAFSIKVPLNSVTLLVPVRKVLSSTELADSPEPAKKKKDKKKDKIKSVDE